MKKIIMLFSIVVVAFLSAGNSPVEATKAATAAPVYVEACETGASCLQQCHIICTSTKTKYPGPYEECMDVCLGICGTNQQNQ